MSTVLHPLDDFAPADLPDKTKPHWKLMGPGAILVGLAIGAGEIIIWPRIVAEYGASMVWAAVLGVFLQMWINLEVGRWTIASGEYDGSMRTPCPASRSPTRYPKLRSPPVRTCSKINCMM